MLVGISKLKLDSGDEHDEECFDSAPPLAPGLAPASLLLDMATLVGAFKAATGWTGSAVKLCISINSCLILRHYNSLQQSSMKRIGMIETNLRWIGTNTGAQKMGTDGIMDALELCP